MLSDKEVKDLMFKVEKHPDTFKYQVEGVSIYFLLRFAIESKIRANFSSKNNSQKSKKGGLSKLKTLVQNLKFRRFISMPDTLPQTPYLFFTHLDITHKRYDNLTAILKHYAQKGVETTLITLDFTAKTLKPKYIKKLFFFFSFASTKSNPKVNLEAFIKHLNKVTPLDFSMCQADWEGNIKGQLLNAHRLQYIIEQSRCKYVYCSSAYTFPWVLLACNRAQVKSIEVQHGVMPSELVYYHSPVLPELLGPSTLIMPSFILTLGQKWKDIVVGTKYIYDSTNTFVLGSATMLEKVKSMPKRQTKQLKVLVAVQPGVYDVKTQLEELGREHKAILMQNNIRFSIRPHPLWDFEYYQQLSKEHAEIFTFENPRKKSLYQSLQSVELVLANTSMCLYEALALGKQAVSFDVFKGQTIKEHIVFVKSVKELVEYLLNHYSPAQTKKNLAYLSVFNQSVLDNFCE